MLYLTHPLQYITLIKPSTQEFHQLSGSNKWKKPIFEDTIPRMSFTKHIQRTNTTTQTTSTLTSDPFQKSLHTTHTLLTLNMDLIPIGMTKFMIRTNCSTKILTINLMIRSNPMIRSRMHTYHTHYDTQ